MPPQQPWKLRALRYFSVILTQTVILLRASSRLVSVRRLTGQAACLVVARRFIEPGGIMQVVRAVHPVEQVRVRRILEGKRRRRAGAELQRKTEVAIRLWGSLESCGRLVIDLPGRVYNRTGRFTIGRRTAERIAATAAVCSDTIAEDRDAA